MQDLRSARMAITTIIPTLALLTATTGRTTSLMVSSSARDRGITGDIRDGSGTAHMWAAAGIATDVGSLAAAGAMPVKAIAAVTLGVATERAMLAVATRTVAMADMPTDMPMPEIASAVGTGIVVVVSFTVVADSMAEPAASTVAVDAGNSLQ